MVERLSRQEYDNKRAKEFGNLKENTKYAPFIYGEKELRDVEDWEEWGDKNYDRYEELRLLKIQDCRDLFKKVLGDDPIRIRDFFEALSSFPKYRALFGQIVDNCNVKIQNNEPDLLSETEVAEYKHAIDEIDEKDVVELLRLNIEKRQERIKEVREKLPLWTEEIIKEFEQESDQYGLTKEEVRRRLGDLTFVVEDSLLRGFRRASHDPLPNQIIIGAVANHTEDRAILKHELHHALLSGFTTQIVIPGSVLDRSLPRHQNVAYGKFGLQFSTLKTNKKDAVFVWLNEAITEDRSKYLDGREVPSAYQSYDEEMGIYKLLRMCGQSGIPEDLFLKAYAEDYDPSKPGKERMVHLKQLFRAVKHAYPDHTNILVRLEELMQNEKFTEAEEYMEQIRKHYQNKILNTIRKKRAEKMEKRTA